jgi:hypothetical protein
VGLQGGDSSDVIDVILDKSSGFARPEKFIAILQFKEIALPVNSHALKAT